VTWTIAAEASRLRKSPDIIADSINNLAKARKMDDGKKEMHRSITEFHQSETVKSKITAKVEEINLVRSLKLYHEKPCYHRYPQGFYRIGK
jgi:hypothetical protein